MRSSPPDISEVSHVSEIQITYGLVSWDNWCKAGILLGQLRLFVSKHLSVDSEEM